MIAEEDEHENDVKLMSYTHHIKRCRTLYAQQGSAWMLHKVAVTAVLCCLFPSVSCAMISGEFVPLDAESGFLACPQSLTTKQGLGYCIGVVPLGAAFVSSTAGADVFLQCVPQHTGPLDGRPYGSSEICSSMGHSHGAIARHLNMLLCAFASSV